MSPDAPPPGDDPGDDAARPRDGRPAAGSRRATIRATVPDPELVAAAVRPDDTPQMHTRVEDGAVVTAIDRATTGGLRSTADDYVVNLAVATAVAQLADRRADTNHE